ncbi:MAG: ABC transporter ATP-binding protein [Deltaproteobacteria bacterium]|nr:MAG: ABC transporter ATP-binding protein [Deltaproteobacteria bacterium]
MAEHLLDVRNLRTVFDTEGGRVTAVNGLSFRLAPGETLGIVGESGSGKSVTQLSILGLLPSPPATIESGEALFEGVDLLRMPPETLRKLRGNRIAMIFQDPMTSLNPFLRISRQLTEVLDIHTTLDRNAQRRRAIEMLEKVGIPDAGNRIDAYPHQFSGGMRQRVMIAMALLCDPALLIADEPTTALDVTIQAQILDLMRDLKRDLGTAIILITHDLGVVAGMADRIIVMYAGRVMESAPTASLFRRPHHPYTIGLLRSLPRLDADGRDDLIPIPGQPPDLSRLKPGCPFVDRCTFAVDACRQTFPESRTVADGHTVACHRPEVAEWNARGLIAPPTDEDGTSADTAEPANTPHDSDAAREVSVPDPDGADRPPPATDDSPAHATDDQEAGE